MRGLLQEDTMDFNRVYNAYFSPSGSTKKITSAVASVISDTITSIDFLNGPKTELSGIDKNDVLIIGMPVFAGRIPQVCVPYIKNLKGTNTPAVALVVYVNRAYGDALLELCDLLDEQGFRVIGAGAFVAEHSLFKQVAHGRPDNEDFSQIIRFASVCSQKLEEFEGFSEQLSIKGSRPYSPPRKISIGPKTVSKCSDCGVCAKLCPVGAIDYRDPFKTDIDKCISCTACIAACPIGARSFRGFKYNTAEKVFIKKCSSRIEPEWFT